jgi:hypothetical protein
VLTGTRWYLNSFVDAPGLIRTPGAAYPYPIPCGLRMTGNQHTEINNQLRTLPKTAQSIVPSLSKSLGSGISVELPE